MATISIGINVFADQLLGQRKNQEDALYISPASFFHQKGLLVVVSDGMGGMARGEVYSGSAVETMRAAFEADENLTAPLDERLQAFYDQTREAALKLRQAPGDADGGATVVAALVKNRMCALLSVGDSRICLYRGGGLIQMNREQTLGVLLDQRAAFGVIPQEVADNMPHRDSLTNHTNAETPMECDLSTPFRLAPGDKLALMSDGVYNTLDEDALLACLAKPGREAVTAVMQRITEAAKPKQDNATIIVLEVNMRNATRKGG